MRGHCACFSTSPGRLGAGDTHTDHTALLRGEHSRQRPGAGGDSHALQVMKQPQRWRLGASPPLSLKMAGQVSLRLLPSLRSCMSVHPARPSHLGPGCPSAPSIPLTDMLPWDGKGTGRPERIVLAAFREAGLVLQPGPWRLMAHATNVLPEA